MKKIVIVSSCSLAGYAQWQTHKGHEGTFPYYLQQHLGNGYDVRQFNSGGASISRGVFDSIWNDDGYKGKNQEVFKGVYLQQYKSTFNNVFRTEVNSGEYKFEDAEFIFVGVWGTNDADWRNVGVAQQTFVPSYNEFLEYFKNTNTKYIVQIPPTFGGYIVDGVEVGGFDRYKIADQMNQVNGQFIDYPINDWTQDMTDDNVHLSPKGADKLGKIIADGMLGVTVPIPPDPPIDNEIQKNKIIGLANQIIIETGKIK